ncbi:MAG: arylsulfatase [Planctomycetes bacterium]|nr:arylsulfatase [Planctomycetota bacterium]
MRTPWLLLAIALGAFGCAVSPPAAKRPNVIVIMTDDQGFGDLGCLGNPILDTPAIDRLAAESVRFDDFYVSPVCAPTRASLMTGRYCYRTRAIDTWVGRAMMEPDEVTLAEVLRAAGYRTGIFGKWHLGDCYPMRAIDQGFDEALVHRGGGLAQPSEPLENARRYTDPILFHNGEAVQTEGYCTDLYFDAAIDFVRRAGAAPFFVYLPTNAPHTPLHDVPAELLAKYTARDIASLLPEGAKHTEATARVFAMIDNIDQNVGRLLATLDESGLADDTIIVYLHDNGPQQPRWNRGLRGTKGTVYEGGIRSPLFVRWPGHLRPADVDGVAAAHVDVLPTVLDLAQVLPPLGVAIDGRSLRPLLEGDASAWPARDLVLQVHRGDVPVRGHHVAVIGPQFKLVHPTGFGRETPPDDVAWELYDLVADPGEAHDVAAAQPEVVARMRAVYDAWFDDVSSTRPDNYAPPRIVLGTDREIETALTHQDWRRRGDQGWGEHGRWLLRFVGGHRYDVRALLQRPLAVTAATLVVGARRWRQEIAATTAEFTFADVEIADGDAELEIEIEHEGGTAAPYQVIVTRQ